MRGELNEEEREALQNRASEQADAVKDGERHLLKSRCLFEMVLKTVTGICKEPNEEEREELQDLVSKQADVVEGGQCQSAQLCMLVLGHLTSELLTTGAQTLQAGSASDFLSIPAPHGQALTAISVVPMRHWC